MLIDFSTPEIKFGSGKFKVSPEGHIHAAGGGDIAGWQLDNNALYKGGVRISSDNSSSNNNAIQVINNNINSKKPVFSVNYQGFLHSERGDIAGWTIDSNKLFKDNVGMASTGTHAFWAGNSFYVNHDGYLYSKDGKIGGWSIKSDRLINDKGNVGMSTGITIGNLTGVCFWGGTVSASNQISLNFWVTNSGVLHARRGELGDWKIANGGLYSDGKEGSVEQKIYTYDKKTNTYTEVKRTKTSSGIKSNDKDNYTYNNTSGGVYVGADGIRFGDYFRVTQAGGLQATGGKIGDISIDGSGLSANNWRIDGSGTAYFTNAYINGSNIVQCALSGRSSGGGVSGGGMRMGSGGAGSSYMNPGVRTSPNGQTWEEYIKEAIRKATTKGKIIEILKDGEGVIDFRGQEVKAETFNGHNMERAGSKLAAQHWVENNYATKSYVDSKIPSTPTP